MAVLGKANMSTFGVMYSDGLKQYNWSPRGGVIGNVYDKRENAISHGPEALNPGTSSGGSAVAIAAGFCATAIGTETRGSIVSLNPMP